MTTDSHLRKGEVRYGSTDHHGGDGRLPPLHVGAGDHLDGRGKGGDHHQHPGHLQRSWPCRGDVGQTMDRRTLQKFPQLLHLLSEELFGDNKDWSLLKVVHCCLKVLSAHAGRKGST